jgi:hypothetical protein
MAEKGVRIRIVSESVGKGFKDANKALAGLKKAVGALGLSLSAAAIVKFGKDSAKAFIEDQKAASQLAQSVKNLGLAFETPRIEQFVKQLASASGVTDTQLRPSMQKLLQTTGSVAKSTELLTQALDISRGSGVDFETVVNDLSMAYVGQTRGLRKYSLGLTKAELSTMSFADVQDKLTKQFSGANAAYLETYAGKIGILSNAASEATEIIGKGLMDSLSILAGEGNTIQPLADSMEMLATEISSVITGLATMIAEIKKIPGVEKYVTDIFPFIMKHTQAGQVLEFIKSFNKETAAGMGGYPSSALGGTFIDPNEAARKAAEAAAAKRAKELAALQAKLLATQKKSLALQKASKTLNLDAIGIEAALKGKISETDRISLLLQKAILEGNATLATQLSDQLEAAIKRNNELRLALLTTPKAPNPYEDWKIPASVLNYTAERLGVSPEMVITNPSAIPTPIEDSLQELLDAAKAAYDAQIKADQTQAAADAAASTTNTNIKLEVDGKTLTEIVTRNQTNDSLSGSFSQTNRFGNKGAIAI